MRAITAASAQKYEEGVYMLLISAQFHIFHLLVSPVWSANGHVIPPALQVIPSPNWEQELDFSFTPHFQRDLFVYRRQSLQSSSKRSCRENDHGA